MKFVEKLSKIVFVCCVTQTRRLPRCKSSSGHRTRNNSTRRMHRRHRHRKSWVNWWKSGCWHGGFGALDVVVGAFLSVAQSWRNCTMLWRLGLHLHLLAEIKFWMFEIEMKMTNRMKNKIRNNLNLNSKFWKFEMIVAKWKLQIKWKTIEIDEIFIVCTRNGQNFLHFSKHCFFSQRNREVVSFLLLRWCDRCHGFCYPDAAPN